MKAGLKSDSPAPWAIGLRAFIEKLHGRVMADGGVRLSPPVARRILDRSKNPPKARYVTTYAFEDKVLIGLAADYLTQILDPLLLPASVAFRADHRRSAHAALREIQTLREGADGQGLFVAECDIRAFFDVLHHDIIRKALKDACARSAAAGQTVDEGAKQMVEAYLRSYSFRDCVAEHFPSAWEEWPEKNLQEHYSDPRAEAIGIPQGGALSPLLANLVLHSADRKITDLCQEQEIGYWRFCDDSLILAPTRETAAQAFGVFVSELRALRLPYHEPHSLPPYRGKDRKEFWKAKSRLPYAWGKDTAAGRFPWIGFLGFQLRFDGLMRLRPSSLRKRLLKMGDVARARLSESGDPARCVRSFRAKILASAFGRRFDTMSSRASRCWFTWVRIVAEFNFDDQFLRALDRNLEAWSRRIAAKKSSKGSRVVRSNSGWSYLQQFRCRTFRPKSD